MSHKNRRHGMSRTPIHNLWWAMMTRCYNSNCPAFVDYGGRGIVVCERWHRFENFYADMGERPDGRSLDRIDNDGPYCPENCQWAKATTQGRNQRGRTEYSAFGRSLLLVEWSELLGIPIATLWARIHKLGWPIERALSAPLRADKRRNDDTIKLLTKWLGADPQMLVQEAA